MAKSMRNQKLLILTTIGPLAVDADVHGLWAIHETPATLTHGAYTLTHVKTGYAFLSNVRKRDAEAARRILEKSSLDWNIAAQSDMTVEHRKEGRRLRALFGDKP